MNKNAAYHPKITVQPNWTPDKGRQEVKSCSESAAKVSITDETELKKIVISFEKRGGELKTNVLEDASLLAKHTRRSACRFLVLDTNCKHNKS